MKPKSKSKKQYRFVTKISGVEYETKVTPKQHAHLRKITKDIDAFKKELNSLKNTLSALSDKERKKAGKRMESLKKKINSKTKRLHNAITKRSHTASTYRANGKKITVTVKNRRKTDKLNQDLTYRVVIKFTATIDDLHYEDDTDGKVVSFVTNPDGAKSIEEMVEMRFGKVAAKNYELVAIKTEDYKA